VQADIKVSFMDPQGIYESGATYAVCSNLYPSGRDTDATYTWLAPFPSARMIRAARAISFNQIAPENFRDREDCGAGCAKTRRPNPGIIKRMLNVVRMRASIARKRHMPLDGHCQAGPLREMYRHKSYRSTSQFHQRRSGGEAGVFSRYRVCRCRHLNDTGLLPGSMACTRRFHSRLGGLEPKLAGIDLKPAVYLARETVPLRLIGSSLSPGAAKAIQSLANVATLSSVAAREALIGIDSSEHVLVMEALLAEMRRNTDWSRARNDFRGAVNHPAQGMAENGGSGQRLPANSYSARSASANCA
jgi:hypothetical protein